jgi:hypothetical protein
MLSSTKQAGLRDPNDRPGDWRPTVSQIASVTGRSLAPLTPEEQSTYRKWKRSTLIFYGGLAILMAAISVAIGPPNPTTAKHNAAYSAMASTGQRSH